MDTPIKITPLGQLPDDLPSKDVSDPALLPREAPIEMPEQDFARRLVLEREPRRRGYWVPRAAVFAGAFLLTAAFGYELGRVLSFNQFTILQVLFLFLSTLAFGWITAGSLSAGLGFLPLFASEDADTITLPGDVTGIKLKSKTALLFPVYHEDPVDIAGTIEAMTAELEMLDQSGAFDVFILSDTRGAEAGEQEEKAYRELARRHWARTPVYYRRRKDNTHRKAGNIKDWVERFGAAYPAFIILDADSVMSGASLIKLAYVMEENPKAGLIQTVPRLTGGSTLLQRLQQFASNIYGPAVAAGLAFWHRDQGNYWGHNAIIRTQAFAGAAGLPELPGRAPFGGHIQSHDFVEAVLLQRAGWGVHMVPSVEGSFESLPPNLFDFVVRDRRWAQGNLQHLSILGTPGITPMGRVHLGMGAFSYIVSAIWASSLIVGLMLTILGSRIEPQYFGEGPSLFPIWPVLDPGAALRLFLATVAVVMLPKLLGYLLEVKRAWEKHEEAGAVRAFGGVLTETLFSMLLAPIFMMTQTTAVTQILLGRDSDWKPQKRDGSEIPFLQALKFHWVHVLIGVIVGFIAWFVTPALLFWMAPIILGLCLSPFITWFTSKPAGPVMTWLLSTPEERSPPAILERTKRAKAAWAKRLAPPDRTPDPAIAA